MLVLLQSTLALQSCITSELTKCQASILMFDIKDKCSSIKCSKHKPLVSLANVGGLGVSVNIVQIVVKFFGETSNAYLKYYLGMEGELIHISEYTIMPLIIVFQFVLVY